jgi:hypothetical protein
MEKLEVAERERTSEVAIQLDIQRHLPKLSLSNTKKNLDRSVSIEIK